MEEIVKVISIDTRKSERSIKDLKNDIKALKRELESTTIGSRDFDLKISQLGKLQQEYKAINEEIVNSMQKRVIELHGGHIVRDEAQGSYDSALYFDEQNESAEKSDRQSGARFGAQSEANAAVAKAQSAAKEKALPASGRMRPLSG